jgi:hypothetical protein
MEKSESIENNEDKKIKTLENISKGFFTGMIFGISMHFIDGSNNELFSLSYEALAPSSLVALYSAIEPMYKREKPNIKDITIRTAGTFVGYVMTRVLYS